MAECTSTDFGATPSCGDASNKAKSTVTNIVGQPAASAKPTDGGFSTAVSALATTRVPRHPGARPKTSVPGANTVRPNLFAPPRTTPA